jgi:multidrug efflux pump subunit AcrB
MSDEQPLGFSGAIAKRFQDSKLTPLLALTGLLLGFFAILVTPREEEPQIDVTFANIFVPFPGASAVKVENQVAIPMEQILAEIDGVKHTYSVSRPGMAVLTVQFRVGEGRTEAIVRLYNAIMSNQDWQPPGGGVLQPLIKPKGIDDVPIVTATLWTRNKTKGAHELQRIAHSIEAEIKRVSGTRDVYTIGGPDNVVHVIIDPQRMSAKGLSPTALRQALQAGNTVVHASEIVHDNTVVPVTAGTFLADADDIAELVVGVFGGKPVYLDDVAEIKSGPDQPEQFVWFGTGTGASSIGLSDGVQSPAVTLAVAKKPGTNASVIAGQVIERLHQLQGIMIPDDVEFTVTRNYGDTANAKAKKLFQKLIFVTASVILLIVVSLGWREAVVVGSAVVITLTLTLFASWAWGFTINRVSLFALIFSIGILVDDAIVVVENIHRHMALEDLSLLEAIPPAVDEVGGPTILATFTVIAALLPMAFVSGLMGPYMSPIPINASMGMLLSLVVALVFTPWASQKLLRKGGQEQHDGKGSDRVDDLFRKIVGRFLRGRDGGRARNWLFGGVSAAILLSISLVALQLVALKMLPFDNKSEFQVILDMPEGTTVEQTSRVLHEMAEHLATVREVTDYQIYAGTAAPINFNGLVRQYYLREGPNLGDIQVNLVDKRHRDRKSHDIARAVRHRLDEIGRSYGGSVKVVEVPPGPPVQAPLVAEIYGPSYAGQLELATRLRQMFDDTPDIVDIDDSVEATSKRLIIDVDRTKAALLGVPQANVTRAVQMALSGEDVTYIQNDYQKYMTPVRLEFSTADKADLDALMTLRVAGSNGNLVPLSEITEIREALWERTIYHKDLLPVVFVTGDMAGSLDSPLYGMFDLVGQIKELEGSNHPIEQHFVSQPDNTYKYSLKWDGEWQITYETFRDMGIAYSVGLILIYLLIVAQFQSYRMPLIIMAPIPLTVIGVLPGHALTGAQFTATSMIGMIALAGIIVRNSILLVDFIRHQVDQEVPLQDAVIRAAAVRARPIVLTALAATLGAFFILDDPIFNGLAVSLIFGILVSTLLTLVIIPVLYYASEYKNTADTS